MITVDLTQPITPQLQPAFDGLTLAETNSICQTARAGLLRFLQSRRARELVRCVPTVSSISGEFDYSMGDEGQAYIDWTSASLSDAQARTVTFTSCDDVEVASDDDTGLADSPVCLPIPSAQLAQAHQLCWDILMSIEDYDGGPISVAGLLNMQMS